MEKLTYTVEESGALLGVSRNTAYACVRTGEIPTIKLARRVLVPRAALLKMLESPSPKPRDDDKAA